jgi:hypothetical protein
MKGLLGPISIAIAAVALASPSAASTGFVPTGPTIIACVSARGRIKRLVNDPSQCKSREIAVTWGVVGPQGPEGPQGPPGTSPDLTAIQTQINLLTHLSRDGAIVFVTSTASTGDLGGVAGADQICNDLAAAADLPGKYLAWISTNSGDAPASRFTRKTGPYMLVDGTIIANNWDDLTDGTLSAPIDIDENGDLVARDVFTNVQTDGTVNGSIGDCNGWTDGASTGGAGTGLDSVTDGSWTQYDSDYDICTATNRLYCFSQ